MSRAEDMERELVVREFTAEFWENRLSGFTWERCDDKERQFKGADIAIEVKPGVSAFIDEKANFFPCNKYVSALCHEIDRINYGGNLQDGWYAAEGQITTHYARMTVFTKDGDDSPEAVRRGNLKGVDVIVYSKKALIDFAENETGLTGGEIRQKAAELRREAAGRNEKIRKSIGGKNVWLTYSGKLYEKPVNLVVSRTALMNLPKAKHWRIGICETK